MGTAPHRRVYMVLVGSSGPCQVLQVCFCPLSTTVTATQGICRDHCESFEKQNRFGHVAFGLQVEVLLFEAVAA